MTDIEPLRVFLSFMREYSLFFALWALVLFATIILGWGTIDSVAISTGHSFAIGVSFGFVIGVLAMLLAVQFFRTVSRKEQLESAV
ncbi:hypothetical protein [Natronorubrum halophilum]|uniref:hypothetical protein n=1 Tax=Natronorubrum halophilum TaxID=1702106 RepID=UPI000EF64269|nr:hypothetical protein [Natronorubrum halophilum]